MTALLAIDFETHWDKGAYSVKDLGNWAYCHHPRFRVLTVAVYDGTRGHACAPEAFDWARLHGATLIAHNAGFDRAVFARLQELGVVPADVRPARWLDSAAAAAYHGLPRDLAGAMQELFGVAVDKTVREDLGQGSLFAQGAELEAYATRDAQLAGNIYARLLATWPPEEERLAQITDAMGDHGIRVDRDALEAAATELSALLESCRRLLPFDPPMSIPAFKAWCESIGKKAPASTAKLSLDELSDPDPQVGVVLRHMQTYRSVNRTLAVVGAMRDRIGPDGRLRYQLKYFGATQTGRWSGSGGLNMQNFNRGDSAGVDLRALFVPEPGHVFVIADYAQIEARVLLWLARETAMLAWLRGGMDLYEAAARRMLGYVDAEPIKQKNPALRQLAKAMVLGLGFGMGAGKFVASAKVLGGVDLTYPQARDAVTRFRETNRNVTDLWNRLRDAFCRSAGRPCYRLPLPSGRTLRYWAPLVDADEGDMTAAQVKGGPRVHFHPGMLAENMVQATARDILAGAWLRCVDAGFPPVLSVHDELVFEVPLAEADRAEAEIQRLMLTPPEWEYVELLPLAVEMRRAMRYGK
jgi:DNA polymerase